MQCFPPVHKSTVANTAEAIPQHKLLCHGGKTLNNNIKSLPLKQYNPTQIPQHETENKENHLGLGRVA